MTFISLDFVALMLTVGAVYWTLPHRAQNVWLVAASLVFYGWIHPWYVGLLLYSTVLDFANGLGIERWPGRKGLFLALSLLGNFGLLVAFKYFGFFVLEVAEALRSLGLRADLDTLGVVLPVGISFYTFSTVSYAIDVYRGRLKACRDPLEFLLFVSFFPQLVAGPISRAAAMLPQIARPRAFDAETLRSGTSLAMWGAFKKVVVADTIAGYVNPTFAADHPSGPMIWAASLGFVIQIYADFSGYSDIARGTARTLGFELSKNFDRPFLSTTPSEWWSRWHVSLYEWIRDYVFNPLVLTPWCRKWLVPPFVKATPGIHLARGLIVSLTLSGVWHGAGWHFAIWGLYYATVQLVYYALGRAMPKPLKKWRYQNWVLRPLMIPIVVFPTIFFCESDMGRIAYYLQLDPLGGSSAQWLAAMILTAITLAGVAVLLAGYLLELAAARWLAQRPARWPVESAVWALEAVAIFVFVRGAGSDFEYFHF